MDLIFDIGNSNIVISWYQNGEWGDVIRTETKREEPSLYYSNIISDIILEQKINKSTIEKVVISSVVAEVTQSVSNALKQYLGIEAIVLNGELFSELDMHVPKPYEIGSDLVANAYAATREYKDDFIIVDFGTALSFTIVSYSKGILGVTITPGLNTSIQALNKGTSLLPVVPLKIPDTVIGKDTIHAIQAGVLYGYIGLVKELLSRIKREVQKPYKVIATGGLREILVELKEHFDIVDEYLTLKGIRLLSQVD
jgi:type III pantothenate kinase